MQQFEMHTINNDKVFFVLFLKLFTELNTNIATYIVTYFYEKVFPSGKHFFYYHMGIILQIDVNKFVY